MMLDAIVRALVRMLGTRRGLLEWVTADRSSRIEKSPADLFRRMAGAPITAAIMAIGMAVVAPWRLPLALPILVLWFISPAVAYATGRPQQRTRAVVHRAGRTAFRRVARRTWRFFDDFVLSDDVFPIMPWELPPRSNEFSDPHHGLNSLTDCGFTLAGFPQPKDLPLCEQLGIPAIVGRTSGPVKWRDLSDQRIEQMVRKMIDEAGRSRAIIGYFIMDEPGVRDFHALSVAVAAVKRLAPGKLAYINLYPDYATLGAPDLSQLGTASYTEYLERFVVEVKPQLISYDNYRVQFSQDLADPKLAASYYRNLLDVRRVAMKHGLPFWNIVSSNQIRPTTPVPSPANLLHQAYTTLAAGASGLTRYTYYGGGYRYAPVDMKAGRTQTWSYLKMVNDQVKVLGPTMRRLKSTGVFFTNPPPAEGLPTLPGEVIESVTSPTPMMIGEFVDASGAKYAMIVSLGIQQSAKVQIKFRGDASASRYVSPVDGSKLPLDADNSVWLTAGQGLLLFLR